MPSPDIYSETPAEAERLPFASNDISGIYGSAVAEPVSTVFLLWPASNPRATVSVRESQAASTTAYPRCPMQTGEACSVGRLVI